MPPPYRNPEWDSFSSIPYVPQTALGEAPAKWADHFYLPNVPTQSSLPVDPLTRVQLRSICIDPTVDVLHAYVCVMAWGRQDNVPGGKGPSNVRKAWASKEKLADNLKKLREDSLTRADAYRLFLGANAIPGLGPSFFTKLLYFFSLDVPNSEEPYIVDNEILDRMTHLTGLPFSSKATCGGYQACCWELDQIVKMLSWPQMNYDGSYAEERLFAWKPGYKVARMHYRQSIMSQAYSHLRIPKSDF